MCMLLMGVITDELTSVVFDTRQLIFELRRDVICLQVLPTKDFPLRMVLATLICKECMGTHLSPLTGKPPLLRCQGVLPQFFETSDPQRNILEYKSSLRDLDRFTLEYSAIEWKLFKLWKGAAEEKALAMPTIPGTIFHSELKSAALICDLPLEPLHFSIPKQPLPREVALFAGSFNNDTEFIDFKPVIRPERRNRSAQVDRILNNGFEKFSFHVTTTERTGKDQYSQVFLGTLNNCADTICLKLYDERLFPCPRFEDDDPEVPYIDDDEDEDDNLYYAHFAQQLRFGISKISI